MIETTAKIPTHRMADYICDTFPWRFSSYTATPEFFETVRAWCEEQWGPSAIEYPVDEDGDPTLGPATDHLDRPWCGMFEMFSFRDKDRAAIFKMFWG